MPVDISFVHISDSAPSTSVPPASKEASGVKTDARTIILCFDGPGDGIGAEFTNVTKLYSLLSKDSKSQLCYYQAGVGTYFSPGVMSTIFRRIPLVLDTAIAHSLHLEVIAGYKFLMQNYDVGDHVCLFGFSRGAYVARALAGMLSKVGLLTKDSMFQVPLAYELYKSTSKRKEALVLTFKNTLCRRVPIDFVGVWDTVAHVGVVMVRCMPFVDRNPSISRVFRQALSLDEHRNAFRPNLYHHGVLDKAVKPSKSKRAIKDNTSGGENAAAVAKTDVKEVWFAGCHSDVGGGSAASDANHALAHIPLRWMIQEIKRTDTHIMFDENKLAMCNITRTIREDPDGSIAQEQGGGEKEDPDAQDAVQPTTDPLSKSLFWRILETIPTSHIFETTQGRPKRIWRPHRGGGRQVPENPLFHNSVQTRMDDPHLEYTPKANYDKNQVKFVS